MFWLQLFISFHNYARVFAKFFFAFIHFNIFFNSYSLQMDFVRNTFSSKNEKSPSDKVDDEQTPKTQVTQPNSAKDTSKANKSSSPQETEETEEKKGDGDDDFDMEACIKSFDTIEEELEYLRNENKRLKTQLLQRQSKKCGMCLYHHSTTLSKNNKIASIHQSKRPRMSGDDLSLRVQKKLPEFLKKADDEAHPKVQLFPIASNGDVEKPSSDDNLQFWSMVEFESSGDPTVNDKLVYAESTSSNGDGNSTNEPKGLALMTSRTQALGGPFILLRV